MNNRIRLLSLFSGTTIVLLTVAGILIVLGIFNGYLNWDIFGPKVEAVLYGIFGSSIALACIGVAMTIVLGTQEIVKTFRTVVHQHSSSKALVFQEAPKRVYVKYMLASIVFLAFCVTALAFINNGVQKHRSQVFKKLAAEQMEHFQPKLTVLINPLSTPPRENVSYDLYGLVKTLDNLSFVRRTTLYLPDPADKSAMWLYAARHEYKKEDGFSRFFVARDFEKAMAMSIDGSFTKLNLLNSKTGFTWYYVVKDDTKIPIAVLKIDGNSRENFREYLLGS